MVKKKAGCVCFNGDRGKGIVYGQVFKAILNMTFISFRTESKFQWFECVINVLTGKVIQNVM